MPCRAQTAQNGSNLRSGSNTKNTETLGQIQALRADDIAAQNAATFEQKDKKLNKKIENIKNRNQIYWQICLCFSKNVSNVTAYFE